MKIERISDNQIRCTLNKEDLEGKETLLSELAFGSEKAKGLFRELMNKAATELGFETSEDNPLMVEAIPVSKECLILVITRVDNPEDFREHYKKLPKSLLAGSRELMKTFYLIFQICFQILENPHFQQIQEMI